MKLIIASDIHGSAYYTRRLLDAVRAESPDLVVLLGDVYNHGPRNPLPAEYDPMAVASLLNAVADRLLVVKGNCDSEVDQMISRFHFVESAVVYLGATPLYFTHGHVFNAERLPAVPTGAVLVHGHTHVVTNVQADGIRVLNPGSLSLPKDGRRAYIVADETSIRFIDLDSGEFDRISL
ncbi:MAG: phosphodiesterase [Clostridia bacterium]|nr:phosphodiesterase [Clostridia bacterium]